MPSSAIASVVLQAPGSSGFVTRALISQRIAVQHHHVLKPFFPHTQAIATNVMKTVRNSHFRQSQLGVGEREE